MARKMVDAHAHPQMRKLTELISAGDLKRRCDTIGVKMVVACSTGPGDWEMTAHLDHSLYKPQVGIHPWYVTENMVEDLGDGNSEWVGKMREILRENPSFGVGEIGIDKIRAKKIPMAIQLKVFQQQLGLAAEFSRPVSVHCVRAYGVLLDILKNTDERIPAIVLHSYGGSAELVRDFCKCTGKRAYFSISARSPSEKSLVEVTKAIPSDRLLIETDSPDQMPLEINDAQLDAVGEGINDSGLIDVVLERVARALGRDRDEVAKITSENAERVFGVL